MPHTLLVADAIPKAADGLDDIAGLSEFFAQAADVRVHSASIDHAFVAPDLVEQFVSVLYAAPTLHQRPQQLELETGEMDPFRADANFMARRIDRDRASLEPFFSFFASPQNRPDAEHDFTGAERLGDIVVCPELQTNDSINLFRFRC